MAVGADALNIGRTRDAAGFTLHELPEQISE
jgi:hypothetical protein